MRELIWAMPLVDGLCLVSGEERNTHTHGVSVRCEIDANHAVVLQQKRDPLIKMPNKVEPGTRATLFRHGTFES